MRVLSESVRWALWFFVVFMALLSIANSLIGETDAAIRCMYGALLARVGVGAFD